MEERERVQTCFAVTCYVVFLGTVAITDMQAVVLIRGSNIAAYVSSYHTDASYATSG